MQKYKRKSTQASFKAAYGLYRKDMFAIRQAVPHIGLSDYRTYYETILLLEDGRSDEARERLQSIKKSGCDQHCLPILNSKQKTVIPPSSTHMKHLTLPEVLIVMSYIRNTKKYYQKLLDTYRKMVKIL